MCSPAVLIKARIRCSVIATQELNIGEAHRHICLLMLQSCALPNVKVLMSSRRISPSQSGLLIDTSAFLCCNHVQYQNVKVLMSSRRISPSQSGLINPLEMALLMLQAY